MTSYSYTRFKLGIGPTDTTAIGRFAPVGNGLNSANNAFTYATKIRLLKYTLDTSMFNGGAQFAFCPTLCWVNISTAQSIQYIETDSLDFTGDGVTYKTFNFAHDYGPDGRELYIPPGVVPALGMVDRSGEPAGTFGGPVKIYIEYDLDIDIRNLPAGIPTQS